MGKTNTRGLLIYDKHARFYKHNLLLRRIQFLVYSYVFKYLLKEWYVSFCQLLFVTKIYTFYLWMQPLKCRNLLSCLRLVNKWLCHFISIDGNRRYRHRLRIGKDALHTHRRNTELPNDICVSKVIRENDVLLTYIDKRYWFLFRLFNDRFSNILTRLIHIMDAEDQTFTLADFWKSIFWEHICYVMLFALCCFLCA